MIATTETTSTGSEVSVLDKPFDRISWGAIFAGTFTTIAIMLVLSLIGMGVGLSTIDPKSGDNPSGQAIGIGAVVWWAVSSLISMWIGGMVAGRAAASFSGYLHGLITWATVTLLSLLLLSSAIGGALAGATGLAQFATNLMPQLRDRANAAISTVADQAAQPGNNPANNPQVQEQARDTAQKATKGGAVGSFGAALALILAAGAAMLGGNFGRKGFFNSLEHSDRLHTTARSRG